MGDARAFLVEAGVDVDRLAPQVENKFASAIRPAAQTQSRRVLRPNLLRQMTTDRQV